MGVKLRKEVWVEHKFGSQWHIVGTERYRIGKITERKGESLQCKDQVKNRNRNKPRERMTKGYNVREVRKETILEKTRSTLSYTCHRECG